MNEWVGSDNENNEDDWLGQVLAGRYRVDARIGRGGMGIVYRGTHLELGKRVAIKRLDVHLANDSLSFERFRREAIAASRIDSPYVVQVFDWGKAEDNSPFIVMELLEGRSLRCHFEAEGRLTAYEAAKITAQILKGLHRIHQARILHRDLKPENVFLCEYDQETPFVKLLDFGISKQLIPRSERSNVTETGVILGTATYMSPEQAKGDCELDARSDLYSLGAVLYEALTGTAPHHGNTYAALLVDICTRDADDVRLHCPLLPEALANVVRCALMREREARYGSATEFLDALLGAIPELHHDYSSGRNAQTSGHDDPLATATTAFLPVCTSSTHNNTVVAHPRRLMPWFVGLAALALVLGALTYLQLRAASSDKTPALRSTSVAQSLPSAPLTATATTEHVETTLPFAADSTQHPTSPAAPSNGTFPAKVRKQPAATMNSPTQSTAGVAGGLKLRRTMP